MYVLSLLPHSYNGILFCLSKSRFYFCQGHFSIAEGLYVSGKSPEAVRRLCRDVLQCATYYRQLSDFARPRQPSSLEEFGLVMEAFRSGLGQFLQHYRAFILAVPKSGLTLLRLNAMLRKVIIQIRCVCNLHNHITSAALKFCSRLTFTFGEDSMLSSAEAVISLSPMRR